MFDDLRRNFVMNPQNGLTIKPFRKAHANRDTDQELVKLTQYLLAIAELDDLSHLDHNKWESFSEDTGKRRRHKWLIRESNKRNLVSKMQLLTLYTNLVLWKTWFNLRISILSFQIFTSAFEVRAEWMTERRIFLVAAVWNYLGRLTMLVQFLSTDSLRIIMPFHEKFMYFIDLLRN